MKFILIIIFFITTDASAQILVDSSKKSYGLFKPVPKLLMREFATDRPDVTESAFSVDAGHFQVETDLFKHELYNFNGVKTINNSYNVANLKLGLSRTVDLQLVVGSFATSKIKNENMILKESGFGGLTLRMKKNLWGNDVGSSALSAMPFLNIPVSAEEKISGGIVFPFAMELPNDWGFGAQFQTDFINNTSGNKYHLNFLSSATVSHEVVNKLDFFVEGVITRDNEIDLYEYYINGGLIYSIANDVNIDSGIYYGLKDLSSRTYFLGLSFRL